MKASVDQSICIGCGLCPSICSKVFAMNEEGKSHVIVDEVPTSAEDEAKEAEVSCPVEAITVE